MASVFVPLSAAPATAELPERGPVDPSHGYPTWYSDGTVRLKFCYTVEDGCLSTPPNDGPASYPDNFPGEAFWYVAEASGGPGDRLGLYEAALEGAHSGEEAVAGEQIGFSRLRFRLTGLDPNTAYTITHPYGVATITSDGEGEINETRDEGTCAAGACDWDAVGRAFLGDYTTGTTTSFLRQVNPPAGTIGNPTVATAVTGAPSGNNFVRVDGPNAGGPGVNTFTVSTFAVQGVLATDSVGGPSTPDLAAASDSGRSTTDNITNNATPTFTGGVPTDGNVSLVVDGATTPAVTVASAGGTYTAALPTALPDGRHTVAARIANPAFPADPAAPEFLTSSALAFTIDRTAPTVAFGGGMPSNPTLDTTPTFSFTASETGASFECRLMPSNSAWDPTCATGKTYDAQLGGVYTFDVRSVDVAGNTGAAASHLWRIGQGAAAQPADEQKDLNGDGNPDLVSRSSDGRLWLYPGNGAGKFGTRMNIGKGWGAMTSILMPGDFSGDGDSDIIARGRDGRLWLYAGVGDGRLEAGRQIGSSWGSMTSILTPGDFSGDGTFDLLARSSTGQLWLYRGNGSGGFLSRTLAGTGWNSMSHLTGVGRFDGDSTNDIVARDSTGRLWLYRGNGAGGFNGRVQVGSGWNSMSALVGTGPFDAGTNADLLARDSTGRLWLYPGNGAGRFDARVQVGSGWSTMSVVQ